MLEWVPSFERLPNAKSRGGTFVGGSVPFRMAWHTTEVIPSNLAGARSLASRHAYPPQVWAWPQMGWVAQTIPLSRAGLALAHDRGDPPTNGMNVIQCEVIGYSKDTHLWPMEWWDFLGAKVLRPIIDAGVHIRLDEFTKTAGPEGYGESGAVRMSWEHWKNFGGNCCHANVPGNEHWDIGRGNLMRIAAAAGGTVTPPPPEDDMGKSLPPMEVDELGRRWIVWVGPKLDCVARIDNGPSTTFGGAFLDGFTLRAIESENGNQGAIEAVGYGADGRVFSGVLQPGVKTTWVAR